MFLKQCCYTFLADLQEDIQLLRLLAIYYWDPKNYKCILIYISNYWITLSSNVAVATMLQCDWIVAHHLPSFILKYVSPRILEDLFQEESQEDIRPSWQPSLTKTFPLGHWFPSLRQLEPLRLLTLLRTSSPLSRWQLWLSCHRGLSYLSTSSAAACQVPWAVGIFGYSGGGSREGG